MRFLILKGINAIDDLIDLLLGQGWLFLFLLIVLLLLLLEVRLTLIFVLLPILFLIIGLVLMSVLVMMLLSSLRERPVLVMVRVKMLLLSTSTTRHPIERIPCEVHLDILMRETTSGDTTCHHWDLGHYPLNLIENILEIWKTRLWHPWHELASVCSLRHAWEGVPCTEIYRKTLRLLLLATICSLRIGSLLLVGVLVCMVVLLLLLHIGPSVSPWWLLLLLRLLLHLLPSLMTSILAGLSLLLLLVMGRSLGRGDAAKLAS